MAARPAASAADTSMSWFAAPTYVDMNTRVSPIFAGLSMPEMAETARTFFGATQDAVDAATSAIAADPACTAAQLRRLLSQHSHALSLVGPGGASALAVVDERLPRLLGEGVGRWKAEAPEQHIWWLHCRRAVGSNYDQVLTRLPPTPHRADRAACAASALLAGGPESIAAAQDAAIAVLRFVCALSFGQPAAATRVQPAIATAVGVIRAAADAGAAFDERCIVELIEAAAQSDPCLHRNMWFGHNFAAVLWLRLLTGWSSGEVGGGLGLEFVQSFSPAPLYSGPWILTNPLSLPPSLPLQLALRYLVAWGALVGRGALTYSTRKHRRLVRCVIKHLQGLTVAQLDRLLAAQSTLPAEHTCSDRAWLARLQAQVERRRDGLVAAAAQEKAARRRSRQVGCAANAVKDLTASAAAVAAVAHL